MLSLCATRLSTPRIRTGNEQGPDDGSEQVSRWRGSENEAGLQIATLALFFSLLNNSSSRPLVVGRYYNILGSFTSSGDFDY